MLTRLDLFVVVRNQLGDRRATRRALALEAISEELAVATGHPPERWGLAGLGCEIDARLVARNPERRGAVAAELLATEGLDDELCAAVRAAGAEGPPAAPLAAALVLGMFVRDLAWERLHGDEAEPLDELDAAELARELERRGVRRAEPAAVRALACAARLGLAPAAVTSLALAALRRAREDLGL